MDLFPFQLKMLSWHLEWLEVCIHFNQSYCQDIEGIHKDLGDDRIWKPDFEIGQMDIHILQLSIDTYMISPNFSLVCIRAQLLWSLVVTARRRRGGTRGALLVPPASSSDSVKLFPIRTIGDEPRRRVDICRPATPPNILEWEKT